MRIRGWSHIFRHSYSLLHIEGVFSISNKFASFVMQLSVHSCFILSVTNLVQYCYGCVLMSLQKKVAPR